MGNDNTEKYLNTKTSPRIESDISRTIHILWTRAGSFDNRPNFGFESNHFVPLVLDEKLDDHDPTVLSSKNEKEMTNMNDTEVSSSKNVTLETKKVYKDVTQTKIKFAVFSSKSVSTDDVTSTQKLEHSISLKRKAGDASLPERTDDGPNKQQGKSIYETFEVNVNDIGLYYDCVDELTEDEKYDLMQNVWIPPQDFEFPLTLESSGRRRGFSRKHLKDYKWLVYSKYLDGCFCIACVLFGRRTEMHNSTKARHLYTEPLVTWSSAGNRLKNHNEGSDIHK